MGKWKIEDLPKLRDRIDELKNKRSEYIGERKALLKDLKSKFGCSNIDEAKDLYETKNKELDKLRNKLTREFEQFTNKYGDQL